MARWVRCTTIGAKAVPVYINLDLATAITPQNFGATILLSGGKQDVFTVQESPQDILAAPEIEVG